MRYLCCFSICLWVILGLGFGGCSGSEPSGSSEKIDGSGSEEVSASDPESEDEMILASADDCTKVNAWHLPATKCSGTFTCTVQSETCSCPQPREDTDAGVCEQHESLCSCTDGTMTCDLDPHPPYDYSTQCFGPGPEACPSDGVCEVGQCVNGVCLGFAPIGQPCDPEYELDTCGAASVFFCVDSKGRQDMGPGYCAASCTTPEDCSAYEALEGYAGQWQAQGTIPEGSYTCDTEQNLCVLAPTTQVLVARCDDPRFQLAPHVYLGLQNAGFTRCSMPFGVLLAADSTMPEAYVRLAAQIVAEMIDQDMDLVADDPALVEAVERHDVAWLAMPTDAELWEQNLPELMVSTKLGYDIIIPSWWMDVQGDTPTEHARRVMVEEITHFLTQFGYSEVYPAQFGVNDWSSVIAKETQSAQCVFWQHPENSCPESPGDPGGDCSDPNCDVVEFYQQVLITRAGMTPGWFGIGFPEVAEILEGLLSDEIKAVMDDPQYHQLKAPLTFNYPVLSSQ